MATTSIPLTDSYAPVDALDEDGIYQNTSSETIRLVFAGSLPTDSSDAYLILEPNDVIQKITTPIGKSYARVNTAGRTGKIILAK
jgi:hypothetical protein